MLLRITSIFFGYRQTESIEQHTAALVQILEACQGHSMAYLKGNDCPPHAKVASDIITCLFNVSKT